MSYIDKNLMPNEKIIFRTKKHWIIFWAPALSLSIALFFASDLGYAHTVNVFVANIFGTGPVERILAKLPIITFLIIACILGFRQWLTYITSDYTMTNLRIIMQEGFFDRFMTDTRLQTISHVTVEQTLVARMFNYGSLMINNFGGTRDIFWVVAAPNAFQKNVQAQLIQLPGRN